MLFTRVEPVSLSLLSGSPSGCTVGLAAVAEDLQGSSWVLPGTPDGGGRGGGCGPQWPDGYYAFREASFFIHRIHNQPEFQQRKELVRTGRLGYLQDAELSSMLEKELYVCKLFSNQLVKEMGSVSQQGPKKRHQVGRILGINSSLRLEGWDCVLEPWGKCHCRQESRVKPWATGTRAELGSPPKQKWSRPSASQADGRKQSLKGKRDLYQCVI